MKASITIKNPVVADVFEDWRGGAVIDLFDDDNPSGLDLQVHVSLENAESTGNAVTDFVTTLLEKAGITHYEFNRETHVVTEVVTHAEWRTSDGDYGSTEDPLYSFENGYAYGEVPLEYVTL
jgi:hypothetical protein